jgi:hypothetical protein
LIEHVDNVVHLRGRKDARGVIEVDLCVRMRNLGFNGNSIGAGGAALAGASHWERGGSTECEGSVEESDIVESELVLDGIQSCDIDRTVLGIEVCFLESVLQLVVILKKESASRNVGDMRAALLRC